MNTSKAKLLKAQNNKIHMYTDLNYEKVYTLKIMDTTDISTKIELQVTNSRNNQLDLVVTIDVIENSFENFVFMIINNVKITEVTDDDEIEKINRFKELAKHPITSTLDYILDLINKGITDKYFIEERIKDFLPPYSLFSVNYNE